MNDRQRREAMIHFHRKEIERLRTLVVRARRIVKRTLGEGWQEVATLERFMDDSKPGKNWKLDPSYRTERTNR